MNQNTAIQPLDIVGHRYLELAVDIVRGYVSNNPLSPGDIPKVLTEVHATLQQLAGTVSAAPVAAVEELKPAVPIRRSIQPDHIICLEDGKKFKSLKRHLATHYQLTPDEYRAKWGLPADYPMVAPEYAAKRSQLAKDNGLGRKSTQH